MTNQQPEEESRLRKHPRERFAPAERVLDLQVTCDKLVNENHPSLDGRRQMTVNKKGPITQVFFAFEKGGFMPEHAADGYVSIHILTGKFTITTADEAYELSANQILMLDPCVAHRVDAKEAGQMLLMVCLEGS